MDKDIKSIEVLDLVKRFGDFTAVNDISFHVFKGEIFGFLGANGAGKTTAMRILCGLSHPTSGEGSVAGFSIVNEQEKIKKHIGYMSQKFSLYPDLKVWENIELFGGIYGLFHISELSWNHVNHPSEVVKVGDEVEVEVLDVDLQRERISLGLKQTTEDPWLKLIESYPVGTIVDGKVTKVVPFGAFVELGNNVEGLVHISEMAAKHIDTPAQVVKVGDVVKVKVMDVNPERRRISLSMKAAAHDLGFEVEVDETIQAPEPRQPKKKAAAPKAEKPATEEAAE